MCSERETGIPGVKRLSATTCRSCSCGSITAEIAKLLRPPEFLEEGLALIRIEAAESHDGCLIGVVSGRTTRENVGAFVGYIADCQ